MERSHKLPITRQANSRITHAFIAVFFSLGLVAPLAAPRSAFAAATWQGQYWNNELSEEEESGLSPEFPEDAPDLTRTDSEINFDWGSESPDPAINEDDFMVRWTGYRELEGGEYWFTARSDDGIRVYVDGNLIINEWYDQGADRTFGERAELTAGSHVIKVEYYENSGGALIEFSYAKGSPTAASELLGQLAFSGGDEDAQSPNDSGVGYPYDVAIDKIDHRLYVSDDGSNRILVFNLDANNQLLDKTADYVIGQKDFYRDEWACGWDGETIINMFCDPSGLAIDETNHRLFVADEGNSRVLVFDIRPANLKNNMDPSYVLGQAGFSVGECNRDDDPARNTLCDPTGVAYHNNRLFVADKDNNRVIVYDFAGGTITNGMNATYVFGQEDFSGNYCNRDDTPAENGLCYPTRLSYDTGNDRLFVADANNNRVVVYDASNEVIASSMDASYVLGQETFDTSNCNNGGIAADRMCYPFDVEYDAANNRLFVADKNNNRVLVFENIGPEGINSGMDATSVIGQANMDDTNCNVFDGIADEWRPTSRSLCDPEGLAFDPASNQLFIAEGDNYRVTIFDADPENLESFPEANGVIGQDEFTTDYWNGVADINDMGMDSPYTTAIDTNNHRLFVSDRSNNRVLVFNLDNDNRPLDKTADYVIGQPDFETNSCHGDGSDDLSDTTMCDPYDMALDSSTDRLFVSDQYNHRVLVYNVGDADIATGMAATYVLGQDDFESYDANKGSSIDASTLYYPLGLAVDEASQLLYVVDTNNSRVLGFDINPESIYSGMDASRVIGQGDYNNGNCNRNGSQSANTLCYPLDVAINQITQQLFVSDGDGTSRVLVYYVGGEFGDGLDADFVLGQENFSDYYCNMDDAVAANTLCDPEGLAIDTTNNRLYVADTNNNRVMIFNANPDVLEDGADAIGVIGQAAFSADRCNMDKDDPENYTLCEALNLSVNQENGDLWVADTDNNRVLGYTLSDMTNNDSEWTFADNDNDGVSDEDEDNGPNGGDANNDGIPDSQQPNVGSMPNNVSGHYSVLEVDDSCTIQTMGIGAESSKPAKDNGFDYPAGLMNFAIDCGANGFTATVVQYHYGVDTSGVVARKYSTSNQSYSTISGATITQETIDSTQVAKLTYQITDGEELDEDGEANGIIVDPSGLAQGVLGAPNTGLERL